jgi:hypothetical protein
MIKFNFFFPSSLARLARAVDAEAVGGLLCEMKLNFFADAYGIFSSVRSQLVVPSPPSSFFLVSRNLILF